MIPFYETTTNNFIWQENVDFQFPIHLHNSLEIVWVTEGSLCVLLDQSTLTVNAGQIAVIFPGHLHGYQTNASGNRGFILISDSSLLTDYFHKLTKYQPATTVLNLSDIHEDVSYILNQIKNKPYESDGIHKAYLSLLLQRLFPVLNLQPQEEPSDHLLFRLVTYLSEHYKEPLSLTQIARDLYVSPYHLSHLMSSRLHIHLKDYLNRLRLDDAQFLLISTNMPIVDVAEAVGYDSISTFNRVFQKNFNQTPSEYRREGQSALQ